MKILVTGIAGFIGYHLALRLAKEGVEVVGVDSLNDYYSVALKYGRLSELGLPMSTLFEGIRYRSLKYPNLAFYRLRLCGPPCGAGRSALLSGESLRLCR